MKTTPPICPRVARLFRRVIKETFATPAGPESAASIRVRLWSTFVAETRPQATDDLRQDWEQWLARIGTPRK